MTEVDRFVYDALKAFYDRLGAELEAVVAAGNTVADLEIGPARGGPLGEIRMVARYRAVPGGGP